METVDTKEKEWIAEFELGIVGGVMTAIVTPSTEQISQVLGEMGTNHEYTRRIVPSYLVGCIDAIYATALAQLRGVIINSADCDQDLRRVIAQMLDSMREQMRERVNKQDVTA